MVGRSLQQRDRGGGGGADARGHRAGLTAYAVLIAVGAYAGAVGLIVGYLGLPRELEQRLPFGSPVLGGIALTVIVAVPTTLVAVLAWRDDPRADLAAVVAGLLLTGWIVVELAFIRELSFFHVIYVVAGIGLIAWGHDALRPSRR